MMEAKLLQRFHFTLCNAISNGITGFWPLKKSGNKLWTPHTFSNIIVHVESCWRTPGKSKSKIYYPCSSASRLYHLRREISVSSAAKCSAVLTTKSLSLPDIWLWMCHVAIYCHHYVWLWLKSNKNNGMNNTPSSDMRRGYIIDTYRHFLISHFICWYYKGTD